MRDELAKPTIRKVVMSEFLAFLALTSFLSGPIFLAMAFVTPQLTSDSPDSGGTEIMSLILAMVGIAELTFASVVMSWKLRTVRDTIEHGVEVKSRVTEYTKDTATAVFEFTLLGKKHQAKKHIFGRQTFPDPHVGQDVDLIVHQDNPDKFVIKVQYL